jgi:phosphoribosylformimino-5-aminoimidazole carboxamide ribotide isomerase
MQIIPSLYIKDGKLAQYKPGDYENIEFLPDDPYELVQKLDKLDIGNIGLIDIDATLGNPSNAGLIGSLSNITVATLHVGGGIKELDYLKSLQYAGVDYFIIGAAVFSTGDFLKVLSEASDVKNDRISIAINVLDDKVTHHAWTGNLATTVEELIDYCLKLGFTRYIVSDVRTSDPEEGPDMAFYASLVQKYPNCRIGAAGHINSFEDIEALEGIGVTSVVIGKEIYLEEGLLEKIAAFNAGKRSK